MTLITLRDIQWRARRIVIGLAATSLVLAIAALLGALHDGFLDETDRTIGFFGADTWLVPADVAGPFTSNSPLPVSAAEGVDSQDVDVTAVAIFRHVVEGAGPGYTDVNVIAYAPGGVVAPRPVAGRAPAAVGEAAVDVSLGVGVGDTLELAGRQLEVVGLTSGLTYNGGTPTVLITLAEGQQVAFDGRDLASAFVVRGDPAGLPDGLTTMSPVEVRDDLRRPLGIATTAIGLVAGLLWVVAAGIVGMLAFLSGLDRHRDFAVYKAHGVTTLRLVGSLLLEAGIVSLLAAGAALVLALALTPVFPVTIGLTLADSLQLLGLSLLVGVAGSTLSVRAVVRLDPATAFASL
jgi:putative ABC transport system permease protein